MTDTADAPDLVQGEFFTDGKSFVFRLAGTPLSGTGATPGEAFADLVRVKEQNGELARKLHELAIDQRGEAVRASVIRMTMTALIVFGVLGGALAGAATLAPKVAADVLAVTADKIGALTPEQEAKFARIFGGAQSCAPAAPAQESK